MQSVIGGYDSFVEAQRAVRSLEPKLSIQDVLIADRIRSGGRKVNPTAEQRSRWKDEIPRYLVVMRARPEVIDQATRMLEARS